MTAKFAGIHRATWSILGLTIFAYACATVIVSAVLFQGRISASLRALYAATGFLIQSTLVGGLFSLAVVAIMVFAVVRLRPADVGWNWRDLWLGLLVTLGFWMAMNAVLAVFAAAGGDITLDEAWKQRGISAMIGGSMGQLFGNSLVEETMFRGFLLPQFYLKAIATRRHRAALAFALIGSSLLFAVTHFPNRIYVHGYSGSDFLWDQIGLFLFGLIMAAAYLVTRNLFIAVGLHSLVNEPTPVIRASDTMLYAVWAAMTLLLLLAWWLTVITRRRAESSPRDE